MQKDSSIVKANNYFYVSFWCDDYRLRYPTGVKDTVDLSSAAENTIHKIRDSILNYATKHELMGEPVIKSELQAYLDRAFNPQKTPKIKKRNFLADHIEMIQKMRTGELLKKRSKGRYSADSIAQYERMCDRWKQCADDRKSGFILSYEMNIEMYRKLLVWLIKQKYSQNSIYNIINNLKIFMKYTHDEGFHKNEVYKHREFTVPQEDSDAIAPTYDEVIALYNTKFTRRSEEEARDLFVYGCFLALRVRDLNRINDYKLVGEVYEVLTHKTGKKVTIPCHWISEEIYEKYHGVMPTFHRQTFSRILPRICKAAGIKGQKLIAMTIGGVKTEMYYERYELITPHSMRRFYATWMYRDLRRQPREIMPITGHDSEISFFKYIKIEMEMNAQEIANDPAFKRPI